MKIRNIIGLRAPAPVNLRRLYLSLLAVTLTIGSISLITLLSLGGDLDDLAREHYRRSVWIDEMTARLGRARVTFHRSINSPGRDVWVNEDLLRMAALSEKYPPSAEPSFSTDLKSLGQGDHLPVPGPSNAVGGHRPGGGR